jgi:hypothetical protein
MFAQIQSRSYLLYRPNSEHIYFPFSNKTEVVQMTWIFPHAKQILEAAQYFEIDASFEVFHPYVFSVSLAIIDNNSFPLGLQISPTENFRHYLTFFQNLEKSFDLHNFFKGKIFLSDMGKAIGKIVKHLKAKQYICYRHLLETFGSNTLLSIVVHRLLFTSSAEDLLSRLPQALSDLNHLFGIGEINPSQLKKLINYFPILFAHNKFERDLSRSLSFDECLWKRSESHVTSCSNHIERLHRTIKDKISTNMPMMKKVVIAINELTQRFIRALTNPGSQALKFYSKLKKRAIDQNLPKTNTCTHPNCNWSYIFSQRFGITGYPCIHTVQSIEITPPMPPVFESPQITSENIIRIYEEKQWNFKISIQDLHLQYSFTWHFVLENELVKLAWMN